LANPQNDSDVEFEPLRVVDTQVSKLEGYIDELNAELSPLKSFVLPGGSRAAANLHQARTIARRAERVATHLAEQANEEVNPLAIKYLNRLSDFLFVAARWCNNKGADDVLWIPGKNR
jgi:cob(I)alamin adenosyltransferase